MITLSIPKFQMQVRYKSYKLLLAVLESIRGFSNKIHDWADRSKFSHFVDRVGEPFEID